MYIFKESQHGEHVRKIDNVRGNLIFIPIGANVSTSQDFVDASNYESFYQPTFENEGVIVPKEVTRRQLFLALYGYNQNLTRSSIRALITNEAGLIEFDEALSFKRNHPLINQLGQAVGMTESQIDQLFINAANL